MFDSKFKKRVETFQEKYMCGKLHLDEKLLAEYLESPKHKKLENDLKNSLVELGHPKSILDNILETLLSKDEFPSWVSKYENPLTFPLMLGLYHEVEQSFNEIFDKSISVPNPYLATLPTGCANARIIKFKDFSPLVLAFDDGVFGYANLLAKAFANVLPEKKEGRHVTYDMDIDKVCEKISLNNIYINRFINLFASYIIDGTPYAAEQYVPASLTVPLIEQYRKTMELFIMSHEYAHLYLGHTDDLGQNFEMTWIPDTEEIVPTIEKEMEADYVATLSTLNLMSKKGFDIPSSLAGILIYFNSWSVLTKCLHVLGCGENEEQARKFFPPPTSHPTSEERKKSIIYSVEAFSKINNKDNNDIEGLMLMSDSIEYIFNSIEDIILNEFLKWHYKDIRVHEKWQDVRFG